MKIDIQAYNTFINETEKPFFIYDSQVIKNQYIQIKNNFPEIIDVFFSMKANPNINIVKFLHDQGAGIEIASKGELLAALQMGVPSHRIVFAGPAKSSEGLKLAIESNIYAINVESINELLKVEALCKELGKKQRVNLRINPLFSIEESILQMGGGSMKFGIDEEQVRQYQHIFRDLTYAEIEGIHVFAATQILKKELIEDYFIKAFELLKKIETLINRPLEILDIGSGFGVDYEHSGIVLEIESLGDALYGIIDAYDEIVSRENFKIILESGRYLMAECGAYVTEVIDEKTSRDENFVLVKGGINHLLRPALIEQPHMIKVLDARDYSHEVKVSVGGQLCTGLDFFAKNIMLPPVEIGDHLVILDTGAYGFSESMPFFLSHDFPAEYFVYNGEINCIRPSKNIQSVIDEQINIFK